MQTYALANAVVSDIAAAAGATVFISGAAKPGHEACTESVAGVERRSR
jgi:hypothetical protein